MKTNFLMDSFGRLLGVIKGKGKMLSEESEVAMQQEVSDFEEFDDTTSYSEGDVVRKDGKLYKFTAAHEGEWSDDDVEQTNVFTILKDMIQNQPSGGGGFEIIEISAHSNFINKTKEQAIQLLGITEQQFDDIFNPEKNVAIKFNSIVPGTFILYRNAYSDDGLYLNCLFGCHGYYELRYLIDSVAEQIEEFEPIPPMENNFNVVFTKFTYEESSPDPEPLFVSEYNFKINYHIAS